jgi:hypothetical protein
MKFRLVLVAVCLALLLAACGRGTETPSAPAAGDTPTPPPAAQPTDTAPAVSQPSPTPAGAEPTTAPRDTPAASDTPEAATPQRPRATATPVSTGPLDFQFFIAGCARRPTADKPGNAAITISIEAQGGNGVYQYIVNGAEEDDKFFDVEIELGTAITGRVIVASGDGQTLEKELFFSTTGLECSG